jgi:S1-C subfamily serine protease
MANILNQLSDELAQTVETVSPSVVRVDGRHRIGGSGIVWTQDGLIVTAHHVLEREEGISIGLHDGTKLEAELVGRDPGTDTALLRVRASGLKAAERVEPDQLKVGNIVLAVGRPGTTARATLGIVSALGAPWRSSGGAQIDSYLQTDVVMYPGFSGGPLVAASGRVAGLNSSALIRGISLAVPVNTIEKTVQQLLAHGRVRWGYLGIGSQPVRLPEAIASELGQQSGALITSVEPGSPAESGGLSIGDTIVAIAGEPVRAPEDVRAHLGADRIGQELAIRVMRNNSLAEVQVTVGERA